MGFIIGLIIFGIPSVIIASTKGFKPLRWLIALGLFGLIAVIAMSSAKTEGITQEEAQLRANKANNVGATMAWINIVLSALIIVFVLTSNL